MRGNGESRAEHWLFRWVGGKAQRRAVYKSYTSDAATPPSIHLKSQ
jgi:hypothetical protein